MDTHSQLPTEISSDDVHGSSVHETQTHEELLHESSAHSVVSEFKAFIERSLEIELVISGAVTFSLLQLPELLDVLRVSVLAQYGSAGIVLLIAIVLAKPLSYLLVGTLLLHLILRSFWIGLVGVSSVYPKAEIQKKRTGFFMREFITTHSRTLSEHAASLDKVCRLLFGFSFSIIAIFIAIFLVITISYLLALILQKLFLPQYNLMLIMLAIYGLFFAPYLVTILLDYGVEHLRSLRHWQESRRLKAFFVGVYGVYNVILGSAALSVQTTLSANAPRTFYKISGFCIVIFFGFIVTENAITLRTHPYFPEKGLQYELQHNHYENTADGDTWNRVMIQSDMITDTYLRLFLPYNTRYDDSIAKYFPEVKPLYTTGIEFTRGGKPFSSEQLQACVQALRAGYDVTLNNKNLDSIAFSNITFRFYTHPKNKQKGIIGYIPTDSLPKGENMLVVRDHYDTTRVRYIPFWR